MGAIISHVFSMHSRFHIEMNNNNETKKTSDGRSLLGKLFQIRLKPNNNKYRDRVFKRKEETYTFTKRVTQWHDKSAAEKGTMIGEACYN